MVPKIISHSPQNIFVDWAGFITDKPKDLLLREIIQYCYYYKTIFHLPKTKIYPLHTHTRNFVFNRTKLFSKLTYLNCMFCKRFSDFLHES